MNRSLLRRPYVLARRIKPEVRRISLATIPRWLARDESLHRPLEQVYSLYVLSHHLQVLQRHVLAARKLNKQWSNRKDTIMPNSCLMISMLPYLKAVYPIIPHLIGTKDFWQLLAEQNGIGELIFLVNFSRLMRANTVQKTELRQHKLNWRRRF